MYFFSKNIVQHIHNLKPLFTKVLQNLAALCDLGDILNLNPILDLRSEIEFQWTFINEVSLIG